MTTDLLPTDLGIAVALTSVAPVDSVTAGDQVGELVELVRLAEDRGLALVVVRTRVRALLTETVGQAP
jgi:hypothetical protein